MKIRRLAVSASLALGLLGSNAAYALQGATPVGSPAGLGPAPEGCSVVADGLINPRYVAVGDDGSIYISEAGTGGEELVEMPAATPDAAQASPIVVDAAGQEMGEMSTVMRGVTGQVTVVSPDGTQSVLVDDLPSYATGGMEVTGPAGITFFDGTILLAIGGAGPAAAFADSIENENSVVIIDPATGTVTQVADIGAVERELNPDTFNVDTNLYGIEVGDDGYVYVNDAGGNATYRFPNGGGEIELVTVYEGIEVTETEAPPGGNPARGGELALDPVPTDIESGAGGSMLVGLLSGFPYPQGAAKVVNVAADGTLSDVATGLTMVVGLAIGPDGHLYVSQLSTDFSGGMPAPGNVVRVLEDGTQEVVVDGLTLPNGIAFDAEGNLLVVTSTLAFGEPSGKLLRCEGVTTSAMSGAARAQG